MTGLGPALRALRRRADLTQEQVGEAADVQFSAVSKWERGEAVPPWEKIRAVLTACGATLHDLADIVEPREPPAAVSERAIRYRANGDLREAEVAVVRSREDETQLSDDVMARMLETLSRQNELLARLAEKLPDDS